MLLRKPAILLTLLIVLLVWTRLTRAYPQLAGKFPATPLLLGVTKDATFEGDIWSLVGTRLVQRTVNQRNRVPIVSPLGDAVAYQQVPSTYVKQRSPDDNRTAPEDIYVMNLNTSKVMAVATQPSTASYVEGQARYTLRSQPAWSLDGKLLAWTEIETDQPAGKNPDLRDERLVVYNIASKSMNTLVPKLTEHRILGQYHFMSEVSPGPDGLIAVKVHTSQDVDPLGEDWLFIFDAKGQQLANVKGLEPADPNYETGQLIWLSGFDKPYLTCVVCNTKLDPYTGASEPMDGTPELYSALAPDKLSLYYGADSGDEANVTWVIALNGKQVSKFDSVRIARLSDMAISPDGMQIAGANYVGQGTTAGVFIYGAQSQQMFSVKVNVTGLGWGPMAWRVRSSPG